VYCCSTSASTPDTSCSCNVSSCTCVTSYNCAVFSHTLLDSDNHLLLWESKQSSKPVPTPDPRTSKQACSSYTHNSAHLHALLHIGHLHCACCVACTTHQPHLLPRHQVTRHTCCVQTVSDLQQQTRQQQGQRWQQAQGQVDGALLSQCEQTLQPGCSKVHCCLCN
jgi:hypothetical protein